VLELAESAQNLVRFVHWSSALVSGARRGFVLEEELEQSGFRNAIEETRFRAERLVRAAAKRLPTTILRPSITVGDSSTGEIDRFEGPYLLIQLMLSSPGDLRMPLPDRGNIPLHLVPIDYVVDAGCTIARDPRSIGKTFHLVDPKPLTAKRVFEIIATEAGRPLPRGSLPTTLTAALLRTPGLDRFTSLPRAFLEQLGTEVAYDARNTNELLADTGITCPPFESYARIMVASVRQRQAEKKARDLEEVYDAYDDPLEV
jgi:nucleoside-diphosphate-sugar epimerase